MKIYFEKKLLLGYLINMLIIIALIAIFSYKLINQKDSSSDDTWDWILLPLFIVSAIVLTLFYFSLRKQLRTKDISQNILFENKNLLQSIIDNTSNPIFIKKINGEYLLINKQCEALFQITNEEIKGKTDYDFLPKYVADTYRNSDLEVVKAQKELKTEETILQAGGAHTYLAVKFPLYDSTNRIYAIAGISTDITERKKLEESLKDAGKFFNMSLDIMVIATEEKFIKINPTVSKTLGYSNEELLTQPFIHYIHPDDHIITQQEIAKLHSGNLIIQFENRWICKDGSVKWLVWSASSDPLTGLIYAIARDVTKKKEMDDSLTAADNFFNLTYDMFVIAKGEYFIKINPAFQRTLGYSQADIDNQPFLSFIHPDDTKATVDALSRLKRGEAMVNYRARARCKDESYKWLEWSCTIDIQTRIMYAVARDITAIVKNEASLKMADTFFDLTFDIITVAKENRIIRINPAFTKTLGYTKTDLDEIKFTDLIHSDDKEETDLVLTKILKGDQVANFKNRMLCKDGAYKWMDWHSNFDKEEGVLYLIARDITEKIKLEEEEQITINELYENQEKLRLVLENISDSVIVANADKKIVMANNIANQFFGIKDDEKISPYFVNHFELYFPDGKTVFPAQNLPMERALNGEATNDVDVVLLDPVTHDKKRVLMSGKPLIDSNDKVVAAVVTIKDISKYKQLEKDLKETETKYKRLIGYRKDDDEDLIP